MGWRRSWLLGAKTGGLTEILGSVGFWERKMTKSEKNNVEEKHRKK